MADETYLPNPFHLAHAISNIQTLIPVKLDIKNPNYQSWSRFFLITVGRFSLPDLLHGKYRPPNISPDNQDYRAIQLKEHFKSLKKGTLSIHDYCQNIKTTADSLADVGHPLTDKQLVLQILHGLPRSYSTVANLVSFQTPLPSFLQMQSLLQMEEHRLKEPDPQPTVLYSQTPSHHPQTHPTPNSHPSNGRGIYYWRSKHGGGGGRGRGRGYPPQQHLGFNHYQQGNWRAPAPPQQPPFPAPAAPPFPGPLTHGFNAHAPPAPSQQSQPRWQTGPWQTTAQPP